jgi:hypothetical protein
MMSGSRGTMGFDRAGIASPVGPARLVEELTSLQSTLRRGRVRSLTGLERQVRFLTRVS